MECKVGDKVEHTDGRQMEVTAVEGDKVTCSWTENGEKKSDTFDSASLKKSEGGFGTNFGQDFGNS